ncbi:GNAT family N-acetyltransferase [Kitasatospora sp. NPDC059673]|uniref:GNAT family N-acetyltransferase n=1 Tax=Kitasatospora sp. NPDC059673 TaxID=3346901 RepID=UPI00369E08F4
MLTAPFPLYLRAAVAADLERLADLRGAAADWIARVHGSPQWSDPYNARRGLARIGRGATVVAIPEPDGEAIATLTLRPAAGSGLWTAEERSCPAGYLSGFVVDRRYAGRSVGTRLLDWARWRAARAGALVLRANVWSDNTSLHAYYRAHGWHSVRTVAGSRSGSLFELPLRPPPPPPPQVHELGGLQVLRGPKTGPTP